MGHAPNLGHAEFEAGHVTTKIITEPHLSQHARAGSKKTDSIKALVATYLGKESYQDVESLLKSQR
jgi:hypothetical protein